MGATKSPISKMAARRFLALVPSWKNQFEQLFPQEDAFQKLRSMGEVTASRWCTAKKRQLCAETDTRLKGGVGARYVPECPRESSTGPQGTRGPYPTLQTRAPGRLPEDSSSKPAGTPPDGSPRFLDGLTVKGFPARARPCRPEWLLLLQMSRRQPKATRVTEDHGDMTPQKETNKTTMTDPKEREGYEVSGENAK